jgi:hypothetical protein
MRSNVRSGRPNLIHGEHDRLHNEEGSVLVGGDMTSLGRQMRCLDILFHLVLIVIDSWALAIEPSGLLLVVVGILNHPGMRQQRPFSDGSLAVGEQAGCSSCFDEVLQEIPT